MKWIITITLIGGGTFYATWLPERDRWHTTIVRDNATRYGTREEAEGYAIMYLAAEPQYFGKVSVEGF